MDAIALTGSELIILTSDTRVSENNAFSSEPTATTTTPPSSLDQDIVQQLSRTKCRHSYEYFLIVVVPDYVV